jgi:hypothetical protein
MRRDHIAMAPAGEVVGAPAAIPHAVEVNPGGAPEGRVPFPYWRVTLSLWLVLRECAPRRRMRVCIYKIQRPSETTGPESAYRDYARHSSDQLDAFRLLTTGQSIARRLQ